MAKDSERQTTTEVPGTNPNVGSTDGGINPSAPTAGTEGWGTTSDEKAVLSPNNQAAARAGQMKGNPGDKQTEAVQRAGEKAETAKTSRADPDTNAA
jgi:hypothetical protein